MHHRVGNEKGQITSETGSVCVCDVNIHTANMRQIVSWWVPISCQISIIPFVQNSIITVYMKVTNREKLIM